VVRDRSCALLYGLRIASQGYVKRRKSLLAHCNINTSTNPPTSQRKQSERAARLANLPSAYHIPLTTNEKTILRAPIDQLVRDVQEKRKPALDVLRAYGKAASLAHAKTNCVTEVMIQEAEDWLRDGSINLQGPLAGIPVSLKDSIAVGGFDVSVGYSVNTGKPYAEDGSLVRLLKSAGAVPFVKTALPITLLSFESFNDVWGRCLNPHNPKYSPGGSTGGEGALLAFGGSRIGIGSDVAGSVRAPAHFSGCYSLRCSTGRWPKQGVNTSMPGQEGIPSVFSPMTRTMLDLSYFTRSFIQLKPWKFDHSVHPLPWRQETFKEYASERKRLRIGVLRTDDVVDPSPACARALQTCVTALQAAGHEVFPISPPSPYRALLIASNLLNADGTKTFRSYFRTGESDDPGAAAFGSYMRLPKIVKWFHWAWTKYVLRDEVYAGLLQFWHAKSAAEQWTWVARREAYKAEWFDWWNSFSHPDTPQTLDGAGLDIILAPPHALPATPHGAMAHAAAACGYTFLFNLLDYSVGVLPVTKVDPARDMSTPAEMKKQKGKNGVAAGVWRYYDAVRMAGLPVGVQVVGRRLEEEKVLGVMERLVGELEKGDGYGLMEGWEA
jgi:Asp-tRNA(Asn)/Glu-tRNA(Gln) amidotransferase A subunit family amidase